MIIIEHFQTKIIKISIVNEKYPRILKKFFYPPIIILPNRYSEERFPTRGFQLFLNKSKIQHY